jgi:hypothetical protein
MKVKERLERGKRRKIRAPGLADPDLEDDLGSEGPATAEELGADGREALR